MPAPFPLEIDYFSVIYNIELQQEADNFLLPERKQRQIVPRDYHRFIHPGQRKERGTINS